MHDHDAGIAIGMRMGIGFRGLAVRGPAGVAHANGARKRPLRELACETADFALHPDTAEFTIFYDRNTSRVVTPVF